MLDADLTVYGNVERVGIPYYSDPGMAAVTTLTVYGDIGELDFPAEHSDGCSVYLTGDLRLGVAQYDLDVSSFADSQRYFAWKGDGTTLAAVVLGHPAHVQRPADALRRPDAGHLRERGRHTAAV